MQQPPPNGSVGNMDDLRRRLEFGRAPEESPPERDPELFARAGEAEAKAVASLKLREGAAIPLYMSSIEIYLDLCRRHTDDAIGEGSVRGLKRVTFLLSGILSPVVFPFTHALTYARELVRRHPESPQDWDGLGMIALNAGEWEEARYAAQMALKLNAAQSSSWSVLGDAYRALGDSEKARWCLEQAAGARSMLDQLTIGWYGPGWHGWAKQNDAELAGRSGLPHWSEWPLRGRRQWRGERMAGRLLFYMQNGHGDCFMMARWVPRVRERVGELCLQVRPELAPFMREQ